MSWKSNPCSDNRENLCLLAAGMLPPEDLAEAEGHLAACPACRTYHDELKNLIGLLGIWEKNLADLEPSPATQARWDKDFESAIQPNQRSVSVVLLQFLGLCQDMVRPCRRIWAGMAAVWLVIFGFHFNARENSQSAIASSSRPDPDLVNAFLKSEGLLTKVTEPLKVHPAASPKPPETRTALPINPRV